MKKLMMKMIIIIIIIMNKSQELMVDFKFDALYS